MLLDFKEKLREVLADALKDSFSSMEEVPAIELDVPKEKSHGDLACNIALKSARMFKKSPMIIGQDFRRMILQRLANHEFGAFVSAVEVKAPGFINFFLSAKAAHAILEQILREQSSFGRSLSGNQQKVQLEFVSANPTGPLSVAHARQAAFGDSLANILKFIGYDVTKEFYVNDEGNQINILGKSIAFRAREILGEAITFPEDGYQGGYIRDMAQIFMEKRGITDLLQLERVPAKDFVQFGVDYLLDVIKTELDDFGVHFDVWSHQSRVASHDRIEKVLNDLEKQGHLYHQEGALWFKTTVYGDDKDRVVRKSDGAYTYFTPDIVYHQDKFSRGFERVINVWGPDHHGYIPRMTAAVRAMGRRAQDFRVLIVQLATIYRDGVPLSMSTRRGQFISLREVMDEVGVDAARFFFLMRHIQAHLDFDLELAKQETPENPVYYIQYAHARIYSIMAKAREDDLNPCSCGIHLLSEEEEVGLMKKLGEFPGILLLCGQELDVFALVNYLQELATCFHRFYDRHRVVDPQAPELSKERLALIDAVRLVLANGLNLLGLKAPQKM
jgi:arginyl-tRNA synthetase